VSRAQLLFGLAPRPVAPVRSLAAPCSKAPALVLTAHGVASRRCPVACCRSAAALEPKKKPGQTPSDSEGVEGVYKGTADALDKAEDSNVVQEYTYKLNFSSEAVAGPDMCALPPPSSLPPSPPAAPSCPCEPLLLPSPHPPFPATAFIHGGIFAFVPPSATWLLCLASI